MNRRTLLKSTALAAISSLALAGAAFAGNPVLKIGFGGVTLGSAAAWGTSNQLSMEVRAAWINETGGYDIGGTMYPVEIVAFDDQKDPKRVIAGMEQMAQAGIHYVAGPNVDDSASAVRPVAERRTTSCTFSMHSRNRCMRHRRRTRSSAWWPIISRVRRPRHLMENNGIKTVACIAGNESDPLSQRDSGSVAARALGLEVVADTVPIRWTPPMSRPCCCR